MTPAMADKPLTVAIVGASLLDCPSYCDNALGTAAILSGLFAMGGHNLVYRAAAGDEAGDLLRESDELLSRYFGPGMEQPDYFIWSDSGTGVTQPAEFLAAMRAAFDDWRATAPDTQLAVVMMPPAEGVIDWFWDAYDRPTYERFVKAERALAGEYGALVIDAWDGWSSSGQEHPFYPGGDYHPDARSREIAAHRIYQAILEAQ
jgi:hypothetical protein